MPTAEESLDSDGDGFPDLVLDADGDSISVYLDPTNDVVSEPGVGPVHVQGGGLGCSLRQGTSQAGYGGASLLIGALVVLLSRRCRGVRRAA